MIPVQFKKPRLFGLDSQAEKGKGVDTEGYRAEFIELVKKAKLLGQ